MINLTLCSSVITKAKAMNKTSDDIKTAVVALLKSKKLTEFEANYILNNI